VAVLRSGSDLRGYGGFDLHRATDPEGPGGVYPWANFLLVNLLRNEGFKNAFINSYADHLNTTFRIPEMLAHREQFRTTLLPEVERHYARWEWPMSSWYNHLSMIATFITQRPAYAVSHILSKFELPGTLNLTLAIQPAGTGRIRLTSIAVDTVWSGTYFKTVPIPLTAVPAPGYAFVRWSDPTLRRCRRSRSVRPTTMPCWLCSRRQRGVLSSTRSTTTRARASILRTGSSSTTPRRRPSTCQAGSSRRG